MVARAFRLLLPDGTLIQTYFPAKDLNVLSMLGKSTLFQLVSFAPWGQPVGKH